MRKFYSFFVVALVAIFAHTASAQYTMGDYTVSPASGATVKSIENVTIAFKGLADGIDAHINPSNAGQYINITSHDGDEYKPTSYKAGIGSSIDNLDLTFPAITKAGTYTLTIAAGVVKDYDQAETSDEGEQYSVNGEITATYTIEQTYMNVWTLDPASGSELTSISKITIAFPETMNRDGIDEYSSPESNVTLTCGDKVYKPQSSRLLDDYYTAELTFETITEPGEYTLHIPADVYKEFDTYENESANPEIFAFYTIKETLGIEDVAVGANKASNVYDIYGRTVLRNANADAVNSLESGIYIVNGKKVLIRK